MTLFEYRLRVQDGENTHYQRGYISAESLQEAERYVDEELLPDYFGSDTVHEDGWVKPRWGYPAVRLDGIYQLPSLVAFNPGTRTMDTYKIELLEAS